jgi:polyribonucleotide nucleotidyltransferase
MVKISKVEREIGGRMLSIEAGKVARQAAGAVVVRYGDTMVLSTVCSADPREGVDFFPLTVDYREKTSAAGKFPGGFFKREGRPTTKEILTMRMIDRPIRPLFPEGFINEIQIQCLVLSADQQNDSDILAMIGSAAALAISDVPFNGPVGTVRVGRVDDQFIINPTHKDLINSTLEVVMTGTKESVNMLEVAANELPENIVAEAIELGHKTVAQVCEMIDELASACGKPKYDFIAPDTAELVKLMDQKIAGDYRQARSLTEKMQRENRIKEIFEQFNAEVCPEGAAEPPYSPELLKMAAEEFQSKIVREEILKGNRSGGRAFDQLRDISGEVAVLPRTHGSALFARGETQALMTVTLGTSADVQIVDGLLEEYKQNFMLHYNFPPFCVGECRRIMGPSRRDIGHGALAEKCLETVMPSGEDFPYTIRLVSDILESNGSSSMATVCAGTLALMDAGVPIRRPVAGISIGLIAEGDRRVLLTDIMGEEDHYGDMDFKVAGTQKGITGIQLDLKARGIGFDVIREAFEQAHKARIEILQHILKVIDKPRPEISSYAPKLVKIMIPIDMIGLIIGPGGREIKSLQESTGTTIEVENDGSVFISCFEGDGHLRAREMIELMTQPVQLHKIYQAKVVSIKDFGVFAELAPGKEGLCHISELAEEYVKSVDDVCKMGDVLPMKVIAIDETGRIKLSRKAALKQMKSEGSHK